MAKRVVNIDINSKNNNKTEFEIKQFEDLQLHVILLEDKKPYFIESAELYIKYFKSFDDPVIYTANEVVGNDIFIDVGSTFFGEIGTVECELNITGNDGVVKTPIFYGMVNKSLSGTGILYNLVDSDGYRLVDSDGYILKVRG